MQIPIEQIEKQLAICDEIRGKSDGAARLAMVDTYGCQQNEADSEKLRGFLARMGYGFTQDENEADLVAINTCAVREHAEQRVLGNIGALTHTKRRNPNQIIVVCGCMVGQRHMVEKLRESYRQVDLVFAPSDVWRFPELLLRTMTERGGVYEYAGADVLAEGLPHLRDGKVKAWLSVMYGCNNFCSYCVVPFVRGRERSRGIEAVVDEARGLVADGYKDITLLGQNVNSYGNDLGTGVNFAELIRRVNEIPGEFRIRFMTSHPKDATEELFKTMAQSEKCAKHIHLPFQAGNDRVLREMNRGYTREGYLALIEMARRYMPTVVITSDVIVGFPGETDEEFEDTLELVRKARFDALFTFIFSKRERTKAASMPDPFTREEKQVRFDALMELQNEISGEKHAAMVGRTERVLVDGVSDGKEYDLTSRTDGNRLVHLQGSEFLVGRFIDAEITDSRTWALFGKVKDE